VIRLPLVIQVPDASDKWGVAHTLCPLDRLALRSECGEHMVSVILDDKIGDSASLGSALRARFNVNVCHDLLSLGVFL
jgi:hypothetical protein